MTWLRTLLAAIAKFFRPVGACAPLTINGLGDIWFHRDAKIRARHRLDREIARHEEMMAQPLPKRGDRS